MSLFVDTSVWSLAWRRDATSSPEVELLSKALEEGELVFTTGLVLQELLQGFRGAKAHDQILEHFGKLPYIAPDRHDHVDAAALRNACRARGLQIGTIDALIAQLCIRYEMSLLTTDPDFVGVAAHFPLVVIGAS